MKIKIETLRQHYLEGDPIDKYIEREGPFGFALEIVLKALRNLRTRENAVTIAENQKLFPYIEDAIITSPRVTRLFYVRNILWGDRIDPKIGGWVHKISLAGSVKDVNKIYKGIRKAITEGIVYTFPNLKENALRKLYESPETHIYTTDKNIDLKRFNSISQLETFLEQHKTEE